MAKKQSVRSKPPAAAGRKPYPAAPAKGGKASTSAQPGGLKRPKYACRGGPADKT
jgi:hypothetical protein